MLPEDKRKQLDGIVQQMVANKESDANIRFVVNDFKGKYGGSGTTTQPTSGGSFLSKVGNFATEALPAIGATIGGIGGGVLGSLGGPLGGYAGAVGGTAGGAALGETLKEKIQGKHLSGGDITKAGLGYGATEAIGGPILSLAGKGVEALGAGIGKMFVPKSEVEAGLLQAYKASTSFLDRIGAILKIGGKEAPSTAASTAFEKGLFGTESMMGVQAKRAQSKLWDKLIGPALDQSKEVVNLPSFLNEAEQKIIKETPELTRRNSLLEALNAIKEDYKDTGNYTLKEFQKLKEGWAEPVPAKAYKGEYISSAVNDVRNTLAGMSREKIYNALGDNVKQAYIDYSNLYGITKLGKQAMTGAIKGGTGTTLKNLLEMFTVPIGTVGGHTIYKVGQGVEILGKPGASILRNALGIPFFGSNVDQSGASSPSTIQQNNKVTTPPTIQQ